MGITGLLPFVEKATRTCHISEFRGGTVAVDSYCFLHKGANACAEQLSRGEDSQIYVNYCIKYVKMLLSYDIHPIMVFDGRNLPAKAETEAKRRESRKNAKRKAAELLRLGKTDEARTYLKQCVDITPKMAHNLIKECRKLNVDCIVAPYESDAQIAFFNLKGTAECVITEDSDLLLFGCKQVLFKLDLGGAGRLVEADKIYLTMKMRPDTFTFDKFRFMCILSGCDYVSSLAGIGLKKAEKFLGLTAETNPEIFIDRIPRYLNMKHLVITDEYKKKVLIANATFLHQVIFNPYKKKLENLLDPEVVGTNPEYLINSGEKFDNEKAYQVALGNLNPYNFDAFDDWVPTSVLQHSIWSGVYKKRISRKQEKQLQKVNFQKYMSGSIKEESIKITEEQVINEDTQIEKELAIYTSITNERVEEQVQIIPEQPEDEEDEDKSKTETSPVISKNPFLKKKISKFPKTYTMGNAVVRSRFFFSDSSLTDDIESKSESQIQQDISKNQAVECEEVKTLLDNVNLDEDLKPGENDAQVTSKKRNIYDVTEETVTIGSDVIVTYVNERVEEKELIESCSENCEPQRDLKKRKIGLGPCRSVGLKKKSTGQKTLHSFFERFKKSK